MKKYLQRGLALILCVVMCFSCMVVPAHATGILAGLGAAFAAIDWSVVAATTIAGWIVTETADGLQSGVAHIVEYAEAKKTAASQYMAPLSALDKPATRYETSIYDLIFFAQDWNEHIKPHTDITAHVVKVTRPTNEEFYVLRFEKPLSSGEAHGYNTKAIYLATALGLIACSNESSETSGYWKSKTQYDDENLKQRYYLLKYEDLYNLATDVGGDLYVSGDYYMIHNLENTSERYVNMSGFPFAALASPAASTSNLPAAYYKDENGDKVGNYDYVIALLEQSTGLKAEELEKMVTLPEIQDAVEKGRKAITDLMEREFGSVNGQLDTIIDLLSDFKSVTNINMYFSEGAIEMNGVKNEIDNLTYNPETKTYTYTTDNSRNFYITNYHINYTSITYIGQTEEYNKYYEVYYQLPDGRSSADLTAQELEQLNVTMDVIPYGRGSDNTSIRALYHFDGDTKDSSYWNYLSSFDWEKGASITYMDAGVFNGALYLDENEHKFSAYLPSNLLSNDFTIQFRYYQSYTAAPVRDSYIGLGDNIVLRMDGQSFWIGNTQITSPKIPTGTWNEIAIIRKNHVRYIYLNGVKVYSQADSKPYTNRVVFNFGSEQQTYKYLDELRVLNVAIAGGEDYTPTSVPHDTNLTLVLPDSAVPVADEYWDITSSGDNDLPSKTANIYEAMEDTYHAVEFYNGYRVVYENTTGYPAWSYDPEMCDLISDGRSVKLTYKDYDGGQSWEHITIKRPGQTWLEYDKASAGSFKPYSYCLFSDVFVEVDGNVYVESMIDFPFTFSIMNEDGEVATVVVENFYTSSTAKVFGYQFGYEYQEAEVFINDVISFIAIGQLFITPLVDDPDGLVYMELLPGSAETDLAGEWVESVTVMDSDSIASSTIAVRTDEEITSFQIGGVRPSLPERGTVWALVESGYITSLQIYDGSAWVAVDGRIWTGSRWIPYGSYNVITLQDMFDIVDATEDYEYIYTESGFYDWLQRALKKITDKLDEILQAIKGGSGNVEQLPEYEDKEIVYDDDGNPVLDDDGNPVVEDNGWKAVDLLIVIKDGVWSVITGVVRTGFNGLTDLASGLSHVTSFYDAYDPNSSSGINAMYTYGGDDIWD